LLFEGRVDYVVAAVRDGATAPEVTPLTAS
jgi:hypothetical protein